ncbi:hypothetical protein PF004_g32778, partial [Phytophthora fragariae]
PYGVERGADGGSGDGATYRGCVADAGRAPSRRTHGSGAGDGGSGAGICAVPADDGGSGAAGAGRRRWPSIHPESHEKRRQSQRNRGDGYEDVSAATASRTGTEGQTAATPELAAMATAMGQQATMVARLQPAVAGREGGDQQPAARAPRQRATRARTTPGVPDDGDSSDPDSSASDSSDGDSTESDREDDDGSADDESGDGSD